MHPSESQNPFVVADATAESRAGFIRRTYTHLALAILAFAGLETVILQLDVTRELSVKILSAPYGWLGVLGAFMVASWMARSLAARSDSKAKQYLGLGLFVVAEAVIFAPLLLLAIYQSGSGTLVFNAAVMTLLLFGGLTATVFITRKDFSFLRTGLMVGGFIALGAIVFAIIFGVDLGFWFALGMIVFACAAILYDTSKVLHHYREDQHVGAALELFASIALLFWYVIRLLMSRD